MVDSKCRLNRYLVMFWKVNIIQAWPDLASFFFSCRQLLRLFLNLILFLLLHQAKVTNLSDLWPECLKVFQECEGSDSYILLTF